MLPIYTLQHAKHSSEDPSFLYNSFIPGAGARAIRSGLRARAISPEGSKKGKGKVVQKGGSNKDCGLTTQFSTAGRRRLSVSCQASSGRAVRRAKREQ